MRFSTMPLLVWLRCSQADEANVAVGMPCIAGQSLRSRPPLRPAASVENNMPHGGTLIVMPPTLIDQWCAAHGCCSGAWWLVHAL